MKPFLKWAGGKRWLFTPDFISTLPDYNRYIEPFIGGGAGFFALEPRFSIISDANEELINLYKVVRDCPKELQVRLAHHQRNHSSNYYYDVRGMTSLGDVDSAARFLYLNRTCWNGLFRLNKRGEFNVPIGTKSQVLLDTDDFDACSKILRGATIKSCDFEEVIDVSGQGDLVFVDPPYTVAHNVNGFLKYNEKIFSWEDQIRLRDAIIRSIDRGASIVVTNADHESVRDLYAGLGQMTQVARPSVISGVAKGRSHVTEILVRA